MGGSAKPWVILQSHKVSANTAVLLPGFLNSAGHDYAEPCFLGSAPAPAPAPAPSPEKQVPATFDTAATEKTHHQKEPP